MTKQTTKQKIEEYYDLSSKPVLEQLNALKVFINEERDNMESEEITAYNSFQRGLEHQYELEKANPLIDRVYDKLLSVLPEKEVSKIINVLTSENYQVFCGAIDKTLQEHAENVVAIIDNGIASEQKDKNTQLH
jgi:predicted transcriptional regulator